MYKISSGRMRQHITVCEKSLLPDDNGEVGSILGLFSFRCDARFKSGEQNLSFGAVVNETVITVLTRYDKRVLRKHLLLWDKVYYEIQNIAPDEINQGMLITAKSITSGENETVIDECMDEFLNSMDDCVGDDAGCIINNINSVTKKIL